MFVEAYTTEAPKMQEFVEKVKETCWSEDSNMVGLREL